MTFNWVGGGTPPDYVDIWENCTASGLSYSPAPAPTADNGLGSPVVTQTSTVPPSTSKSSTGQFITYKFTGGTSQFQITRSPFASGQQRCSVRYTATISPLAVAIFSDRDQSYHKGFDQNNEPIQVSNLTELLSLRFGDTVLNDSDKFWSGPVGGNPADPNNYTWYVLPEFSRDLLGNWSNPYHVWTGDAGNYTDTYFTEYDWIQPNPAWTLTAAQYAALSRNGPLVKTINLTVSNDGGNGPPIPATYKLRIHHQYEFWQKADLPGVSYVDVANFSVANPGYALGGGGITCYWTKSPPWWSFVTSATSVVGPVVSAAQKNPKIAVLFEVAGIVASQLEPSPLSGNAPWAWNWEGSTIVGGTWSDNPNYFKMEPMLQCGFKNQLSTGDEYGTNGYVGIAHDRQTVPDGSYRWRGHFSPVSL